MKKIINLDRRIIFISVVLAVIIPTLWIKSMPVSVTVPTQNVYDYIENLPPGATVMICFDYGPSTMPEPTAIAEAVLRHCFTRGVKVIGLTLFAEGIPLAVATLQQIAKEKGAVEGEDYVFLGYRPGPVLVMIGMGTNIANIFGTDYAGTPVSEILLMREVVNYNDIDLVFDIASSNTVEYWIIYAQTKYDVKIAAGTTAVITTQLYPYLQTGQLIGLLNGYLGAAEYETLTGELAKGTVGLNTATVVHLLIIVLVILGNIIFFIQHRRQKRLSETTA
ncbi:MAG: hypothetical protein OXG97_04370 [Candidatus Poribacteria bacterium]|nr:hypothetical protein [Candidatus Poribacteria bacterium]